jgi:hypothetical protein
MKKILCLALATSLLFVACSKDKDDSLPNNNRSVGSSAAELLKSATFSRLVLEIRYIDGYAPPAQSIEDLKSFITTYCNKPNGVEVVSMAIPESPKAGYTLDDIRSIEDKYRTRFNSEGTASLFVFMAAGDYVENNDTIATLGIAYKNTSMVLFGKTIDDNSGGLSRPSEATVTSAIFQHEMGHILGLVNLGSSMQNAHEDGDHTGHCDNEECLMYFSLNSVVSMAGLMGGIPALDANCRADLRANGGK